MVIIANPLFESNLHFVTFMPSDCCDYQPSLKHGIDASAGSPDSIVNYRPVRVPKWRFFVADPTVVGTIRFH